LILGLWFLRDLRRIGWDASLRANALKAKTSRLKEKIAKLRQQMQRLERLRVQMPAAPDQQISLTDL
jgi:hypothetical protein